MSTPEGRVKRKISSFLKTTDCFYDMPVPGGYGKSTLDYVGCFRGYAFYIEAKAPGRKPTLRQQAIIATIKRAGGKVFVVDGDISELERWFDEISSGEWQA